jgi:phenylalanine-4-hydroxylase
LGIEIGKKTTLIFVSGVAVAGKVDKILRRDDKLILISFTDCTVKYRDRVLFEPSWGTYDMAVGGRVSSVFNGAADKDAYNQVALVPRERTIKVASDAKRKKLENLYVRFGRARWVTSDSAKFGKHSRPSIRAIGYCRWKFSKFSTRQISSRS